MVHYENYRSCITFGAHSRIGLTLEFQRLCFPFKKVDLDHNECVDTDFASIISSLAYP